MLQWILIAWSLFTFAQNLVYKPTQNHTGYYYSHSTGKYYYLANNGYYYEYSQPQPSQYQNQVQEQKALATPYWTQGTQGYYNGQPSQTYAYPTRY
jgi:hypothetical protein